MAAGGGSTSGVAASLKSNLDGAGLGNHAAERRKQLTNSRGGGEKLWDETGVALWVPREHGRELRR